MRWLDVFGIVITLCFLLVEPTSSQPDWVEKLNQEIYGTLYSARSGVNTSELIPSYTVSPLPDATAEPPLAVLVARGAATLGRKKSLHVLQLALCCRSIGTADRTLQRLFVMLWQEPQTL